MVTLTNNPILPSLRKSAHLIAEFHWRLRLCEQVKTKLQHNVQMFSQQLYWGIIPVNMTFKIFYKIMWMIRALWLVVVRDLLEDRYLDDITRNLFSLFCSTWLTVLKMFLRLFRIKANESLDKGLARAIYEEEKWRNGDKKNSWLLKYVETTRNLHNSCHRVSSLRETRCFAKCCLHHTALSRKRCWKTFRTNCIQVR